MKQTLKVSVNPEQYEKINLISQYAKITKSDLVSLILKDYFNKTNYSNIFLELFDNIETNV